MVNQQKQFLPKYLEDQLSDQRRDQVISLRSFITKVTNRIEIFGFRILEVTIGKSFKDFRLEIICKPNMQMRPLTKFIQVVHVFKQHI